MTAVTRRGFIRSVAAVAAASAMPSAPALAETAAPIVEAATHPFARLTELLSVSLDGDFKHGAAFAILPDEIVEHFGGHRSAIDWPDGDYGVFADNHTGHLIVYRVRPDQGPELFSGSFWQGGEPEIQFRRPRHWSPLQLEISKPDLKPTAVVDREERPWPLASWEMM